MPDIILPGPAGRIEARYQRQKAPGAPMALVLHPHPQFGGTMNNPLVYDLFHMFHGLGCTTVRFNFRGVGRSQGTFDSGAGELSDAAAVLDWMNTLYPNPSFVWVCGISFGAWIGMQLSDAPARRSPASSPSRRRPACMISHFSRPAPRRA
jgi:alpha/beta superfamily hydrolase